MGARGENATTNCGGDSSCCHDLTWELLAGESGPYLHVANEMVIEGQGAKDLVAARLGDAIDEERSCCVELCGYCYCIVVLHRDFVATLSKEHPAFKAVVARRAPTESGIPAVVDWLRADLPDIKNHIHPHYVLTSNPDAQWSPIAQPLPWKRPVQVVPPQKPGEGISVGILDSGWFFSPIGKDPEYEWIRSWFEANGELIYEEQPQKIDDPATPADGHGPFAASRIMQASPGVRVAARPITTFYGYVTDCQLAEALCASRDFFAAQRIRVLSLSFGTFTHGSGTLPLTAQVLDSYFEHFFRLQDLGVAAPPPAVPRPIVVASAGNRGTSQPVYPAALAPVVAVGALNDSSDAGYPAPACWSNRGSWVHAYAPGTNVTGIYLTGTHQFRRKRWRTDSGGHEIELPEGCTGPGGEVQKQLAFNGWALWQGTSFAAPFVAGRIAGYLAEGYPPAEAVMEVGGTVT